jgi:hypothetical protein
MLQKVISQVGNLVTGKMAKEKTVEGITPGAKTRAFYVSLFSLIGMFIYGDLRGADTMHIINNISNLALSYIVGVAVIDSVKSYKKTNPLTEDEVESALKERYKDK